MLELDWRVWASLALIGLILYWAFVPPKAKRKELFEQMMRKQKRTERIEARPKTYTQLMITGLTARRGDSVIMLTSGGTKTLTFDGIAQGHYSETVYVVVSGEGEIKQHTTETLAQNDYKKGDYGILAVTMSPGSITQRSIVPEIIHSSNAFQLEFSARVNTK